VLKYIVPACTEQYQYYEYVNAAENLSLMLFPAVLWIAQSGSREYEYRLSSILFFARAIVL
jgi:hypothetical protein